VVASYLKWGNMARPRLSELCHEKRRVKGGFPRDLEYYFAPRVCGGLGSWEWCCDSSLSVLFVWPFPAAGVVQRFWRLAQRRQLEIRRVLATHTIHKMIRAHVWRQRLARANPRRDAAIVTADFLEQCQAGSFLQVGRRSWPRT